MTIIPPLSPPTADSSVAVKRLSTPLSEAVVRDLRAGDFILLSGTFFTARDAVHKYLDQGGELPCCLADGIIYHCGPVVIADGPSWQVTAAGPTTSIREEPYMSRIIARHGIRGIIGKGGMGSQTLAACREYGCVYFHAVGGAAQILAQTIRRVTTVYLLERFGAPEAVWQLEVSDFPVTVTMDSHGTSLHAKVEAAADHNLQQLLSLSMKQTLTK